MLLRRRSPDATKPTTPARLRRGAGFGVMARGRGCGGAGSPASDQLDLHTAGTALLHLDRPASRDSTTRARARAAPAGRRITRRLTLSELVETYFDHHDVQSLTTEKLRY